ncbi:rhomboid family intramembrane serine protease [Flavobacterium selenitireducens]|uniref:rhomboid family intramembrane serine protease n=1 Tax=Flavobacterium selenitireducens TaxID=2722704 RepID=UPI00168B6239|nr:rhomboid family intramembrane serine protease [Flavobacterium selenitireducens]MBD3582474.1 rhomboid family intramembrane serine protease [Flavobacterium selenitireducens]
MSRILNDLKNEYALGGPETRLIIINVAIFIVSALYFAFVPGSGFPEWLALRPGVVLYYPWTVVTYSFLHANFMHILSNMLVLNFSARLFRTYFTIKQFLGVYFLGAVFAALVYIANYYIFGLGNGLVGASAAVMAVLVAITTYNPTMEVRLLLIGNVKLWIITGLLIFLDLISIPAESSVSHLSHLSAALFGFVYMKLLQSGTDLSRIVTSVIEFFANLFKPSQKTKFKKVHRNYDNKASQKKPSVVTKDRTQQQIDEILDKISRSGYDSLTKDEKDFLFRAGK